eukprot:gene10474-biopygen244
MFVPHRYSPGKTPTAGHTRAFAHVNSRHPIAIQRYVIVWDSVPSQHDGGVSPHGLGSVSPHGAEVFGRGRGVRWAGLSSVRLRAVFGGESGGLHAKCLLFLPLGRNPTSHLVHDASSKRSGFHFMLDLRIMI